jgi:hypothetical protein
METEELDPMLLVGRFVIEIGKRQAWPFLGIREPQSGREIRLYVDTTCSVSSRKFRQDDAKLICALERLNSLTISQVDVSSDALILKFGNEVLRIGGVGNDLTTQAPWWVGMSI